MGDLIWILSVSFARLRLWSYDIWLPDIFFLPLHTLNTYTPLPNSLRQNWLGAECSGWRGSSNTEYLCFSMFKSQSTVLFFFPYYYFYYIFFYSSFLRCAEIELLVRSSPYGGWLYLADFEESLPSYAQYDHAHFGRNSANKCHSLWGCIVFHLIFRYLLRAVLLKWWELTPTSESLRNVLSNDLWCLLPSDPNFVNGRKSFTGIINER